MHLLHEKLGPLVLQFPWFNKHEIQAEFFRRLHLFLKRIMDLPTVRFAVEIRNKAWLDKRFTDLLREHNVALALTDPSNMPRDKTVIDRTEDLRNWAGYGQVVLGYVGEARRMVT